jgi:uncharacterized membrane protein YoaT (DUF817 family)
MIAPDATLYLPYFFSSITAYIAKAYCSNDRSITVIPNWCFADRSFGKASIEEFFDSEHFSNFYRQMEFLKSLILSCNSHHSTGFAYSPSQHFPLDALL